MASAGGLAGIAVGTLVLRLMLPWIPATGLHTVLPPDTVVAIDRSVWLFAMAVSTLSGVAFGLAPAVGAVRSPLFGTIREGTPSASAGRSQNTLQRALVV